MEILLLGLLLSMTSSSGGTSGTRSASKAELERIEIERLNASYRRRNGLARQNPYTTPEEKIEETRTTTVNVGSQAIRFDMNKAFADAVELAKRFGPPAPTPQGQRVDPTMPFNGSKDYDWANRP